MRFEVGELRRRAVLVEIRGRGADDARVRRDAARDERGIFQLADADREVESFADDVDKRIGDVHVELDLGIARQEIVDVGGDVQPAEGGRHGDLQQAARLGVAAADEVLGLLAEAEDIDDALEVAGARFGQRQVPCGALEKPGAEALLELADALRHNGGRKAHLAAGGRHVAGPGDACEYVQITYGSHVSPVGKESPARSRSQSGATG